MSNRPNIYVRLLSKDPKTRESQGKSIRTSVIWPAQFWASTDLFCSKEGAVKRCLLTQFRNLGNVQKPRLAKEEFSKKSRQTMLMPVVSCQQIQIMVVVNIDSKKELEGEITFVRQHRKMSWSNWGCSSQIRPHSKTGRMWTPSDAVLHGPKVDEAPKRTIIGCGGAVAAHRSKICASSGCSGVQGQRKGQLLNDPASTSFCEACLACAFVPIQVWARFCALKGGNSLGQCQAFDGEQGEFVCAGMCMFV